MADLRRSVARAEGRYGGNLPDHPRSRTTMPAVLARSGTLIADYPQYQTN